LVAPGLAFVMAWLAFVMVRLVRATFRGKAFVRVARTSRAMTEMTSPAMTEMTNPGMTEMTNPGMTEMRSRPRLAL
jgi:hypothetical protein